MLPLVSGNEEPPGGPGGFADSRELSGLAQGLHGLGRHAEPLELVPAREAVDRGERDVLHLRESLLNIEIGSVLGALGTEGRDLQLLHVLVLGVQANVVSDLGVILNAIYRTLQIMVHNDF